MQISRIALVAASATLAACATTPAATGSANTSTQASTTTTQPKPAKVTAASKTRITADEAMKLNVPTAYEVVNRLHPQWYRHVGGEGTSVPIVFVNNQRQEGTYSDILKLVPAADIIQIDYSKASEAMMKYGPDAKGGAILVLRK